MSENPPVEEVPDDDAQPLTGRRSGLRRCGCGPERVTRLSRKVLAGLGLVASVGLDCADLRASDHATPVGRTTNSIRPRTARR